MASLGETLSTAIQHHQAGDLQAAERIYRTILKTQPRHADALHLLGLIALQVGQHQQACEKIRQAIEVNPNAAAFHSNLGIALMSLGQTAEAAIAYRRAVALKPDYAEAHNNLGAALREEGQLDEAVAACQRALHHNPNYAEALYNLATAQHSLGNVAEAIASCQRALQLKPNFPNALYILGVAFGELGEADKAIGHLQQLIQIEPKRIEAYNQLAIVQRGQGRLEDATKACKQAIDLDSECADAYNTLGTVLQIQGRLTEAIDAYQRALLNKPEFSEAHNNLGVALLSQAEFELGWEEYEWRWKTAKYVDRGFTQPQWNGDSLAGRTILVHAEQGFGDTIQFVRYLTLVQHQGGRVLFECPEPLCRLLANAPGIDALAVRGNDLPQFDVQIPLLSLPRVLKTRLDTIPAAVAYLSVDAKLVAKWKEQLKKGSQRLVGICWQGRPDFSHDRFRSIPFSHFAQLAQVPDVRLVSIQKGPGRTQLQSAPQASAVLDLSEELYDFVDTAAVMMNLDLLVTSDTAVAHLAGALGIPVWLATQYAPDWRWMQDREDSPWYPTMRLFRQATFGDWEGVFARIDDGLRKLTSGTPKPHISFDSYARRIVAKRAGA